MVRAEYDDLTDVLDDHFRDDLRVTSSHDGIRVYRVTGETNQWDEPEDELLWSYDPSHDRWPSEALDTLFGRIGLEVEKL
jgi:hypothetical protein